MGKLKLLIELYKFAKIIWACVKDVKTATTNRDAFGVVSELKEIAEIVTDDNNKSTIIEVKNELLELKKRIRG